MQNENQYWLLSTSQEILSLASGYSDIVSSEFSMSPRRRCFSSPKLCSRLVHVLLQQGSLHQSSPFSVPQAILPWFFKGPQNYRVWQLGWAVGHLDPKLQAQNFVNESQLCISQCSSIRKFLNLNLSFFIYKLGLTEPASELSLLRNIWVSWCRKHSTIMSIKLDLTICSYYFYHHHNPCKPSQFLEEHPEVQRGNVGDLSQGSKSWVIQLLLPLIDND